MGSALTFVLGIGLYGLTYLYPLYLARVRGYNVAADRRDGVRDRRLHVRRGADRRHAGRAGPIRAGSSWSGSSASRSRASSLTGLTADWAFWELFSPQALRGVALMCCMIPINMLALGTLPPDRIKNASGLFNLTRNLGGAFGLAAINTLLQSRTDLHVERLGEHVAWGAAVAEERLAGMTASLEPVLGADAEAGGAAAARRAWCSSRGW